MKWLPIETAPLDDVPVLLYVPGVTSWNRATGLPDMAVGIWDGSAWVSDIGDIEGGYESTGEYFVRERLQPTHWMPLPKPPTRQLGENDEIMLGMRKDSR